MHPRSAPFRNALTAVSLALLAAGCTDSATSTPDAPSTPSTPTAPPGPSTPPSPTDSIGTNGTDFKTRVPVIDLNVVLARPSAASVTLSVLSRTDRDATITWSPAGSSITRHLTAGVQNEIELTSLAADRGYAYRVDAGSASVQGQFHTARAAGASYRFVMQADSHLDNNSDPRIYTNTLANMTVDAADFLVDLGDTFMTDKYADYHDAAPQYYAQRHYFGLVGRTTPSFLVQGNHDGELGWLTAVAPWAAATRRTYFPQVAATDFYSSAVAPRNYYAWTWGDATFIVLDPYGFTVAQPSKAGTGWAWTLGKEQYDWLQSTLQRKSTAYTFVFLHNLVGGQGTEARGGVEASVSYEWGGANADGTPGFATQRAGWAKPIHDLLVQYKVSAVFHGHDHLYVHQQRDGIAYQEVPQPSFAREGATSSAVDYGYLSGTLLGSSGHLRVTVTPAKATVEYVRSRLTAGNGDVADRYDILPRP